MPRLRHTSLSLLLFGCVSAFAAELDPFALVPVANLSNDDEPSRASVSLDFIHQSSYIPDVIFANGNNVIEHQTMLDLISNWEPLDGIKFKLRGIGGNDAMQVGSDTAHNYSNSLLEAFYEQKFDGYRHVLSLGRKQLGWSSGFQWRPADVIENGFTTKNINTLDPSRYRGVDQGRYDFNGTDAGFSVVLSNHEHEFFGGNQLAVKLDFKSLVDVSSLYAKNGNYSKKYGIVLDSGLPWAMTVRLEAVHVDIDKTMLFDADHFGQRLESLSGVYRYEDVFLGLTKFFDDKRRINVEYFYSGRGFNTAALHSTAMTSAPAPTINPAIFEEEYLGKNYTYIAYTGYIDNWKLEFKPSVLMNTDDKSYICTLSFSREIGGNSELTFNVNTFNGDLNSEFGSITRSAGFGLSYILHMF